MPGTASVDVISSQDAQRRPSVPFAERFKSAPIAKSPPMESRMPLQRDRHVSHPSFTMRQCRRPSPTRSKLGTRPTFDLRDYQRGA
jgi:hypothetical protein